MSDGSAMEQYLERSRLASGVPRYVTDPAAIQQIAELVHGGNATEMSPRMVEDDGSFAWLAGDIQARGESTDDEIGELIRRMIAEDPRARPLITDDELDRLLAEIAPALDARTREAFRKAGIPEDRWPAQLREQE